MALPKKNNTPISFSVPTLFPPFVVVVATFALPHHNINSFSLFCFAYDSWHVLLFFFTSDAHFLSFYHSHFRPFAQSTTWSDSCKQTTCNEVKSEKKTIEILICISFVEFEMYQTNSTFHTKYTHTKPIIKCFVFFPTFYSCLCAAA